MNGFSFYRPEFLWGLLFLLGVLLVHLLRRPRARAIDFSTLRFFREQAVAASRMRQLRSLLLLLARMCAVFVLVALFAQPFDKSNRLSLLRDPHLTLFLWIDRTPSMDYASGGASILARARSLADSLKAFIPATARFLYFDEARNEFVPFDNTAPLRTRHGPHKLERVLRAWNESRSGFSMPLLMLVSDYQKATAGALDSLLRGASPRSSIACVTLMPGGAPRNFSVRTALFHETEGASRVSLSVAAQGGNLDSGELAVTMGGISAGKSKISVKANDTGKADIEVGGALKSPGGSVTLAAKDPLLFDNTLFFNSKSRPARRVVVVGDRDKNFPIAAAFLAAGADRWNPVTMKGSDQVDFDELDFADVIVLGNIERSSRHIEAFLSSRSSAEKVVLCALGADDESFGRSAMLVSKINRSSRPLSLTKLDAPVTVVLPDTLSVLWRGFPALQTREAAIYRYVEGLPGTPLLRLGNGASFVTRVSDEGRSWILIGSPLGVTDANNLCETGFYVPFIDRLVRYGGGESSEPPDTWIAGVERRNPVYNSGKGASVFSEDGKLLERWLSQPNVLVKEPGIYRIAPDGGEVYGITVNPDPAESDLLYARPTVSGKEEDRIMILNEIQLYETFRGRGRLLSYFPWMALVLLLLAEILLWERNARARHKSAP